MKKWKSTDIMKSVSILNSTNFRVGGSGKPKLRLGCQREESVYDGMSLCCTKMS